MPPSPLSPSELSPRTQIGRLLVPDLLRGIAIIAMLIAHAVPIFGGTQTVWIVGQINDLASPLFALVMGMSAQIVARRGGSGAVAFLVQQVVRGIAIIAIGAVLVTWNTWIAVVLPMLGLTLLLGAPLLLLSTRWLGLVTVLAFVIASPLNDWLRSVVPIEFIAGGSFFAEVLRWFALDGHYRTTNLLCWFLVGALLLRHGFGRSRLWPALLVVGALGYLVRPALERLGFEGWVSGSSPDTLHDAGLVLFATVAVVALAGIRGVRESGWTWPLQAVGSLALSVYVLQLVIVWWMVLATWYGGNGPVWLQTAVLILAPCLFAMLWWRFVGKGPIEWLVGALGRLALGPSGAR